MKEQNDAINSGQNPDQSFLPIALIIPPLLFVVADGCDNGNNNNKNGYDNDSRGLYGNTTGPHISWFNVIYMIIIGIIVACLFRSQEPLNDTVLTLDEFGLLPIVAYKGSPSSLSLTAISTSNDNIPSGEERNSLDIKKAASFLIKEVQEQCDIDNTFDPEAGFRPRVLLNTLSIATRTVSSSKTAAAATTSASHDDDTINPELNLNNIEQMHSYGSKKSTVHVDRQIGHEGNNTNNHNNLPELLLTTTSTSCSICIEDFIISEMVVVLPQCKHAFHEECIKTWLLEKQGCCALCKTDVLSNEQKEIRRDHQEQSLQQRTQ